MKRKIWTLTLMLMLTLAVVLIASPAEASAAAPPEGSIIQDPAFYAAVLDIIDEADGYVITANDVCDIEVLRVASRQIKSLSGIEHFTALSELYCYENQLTELDVSENTELRQLYCSNNQLTELDVSENTELRWLYCSNNQLTELDVSKNTRLGFLDCSFNQLTELDVSNNTGLIHLNCANNKLTELDVSNNTGLQSLSCSGNLLTELDVSNNTGLMQLSCSNNQLTELDVSKNTKLWQLYCSNNLLTELDVTGLEDLRYIDVRFNNIADKTAVIGVPADKWEVADEQGWINFRFSPQGNIITAAPDAWNDGDGDITVTFNVPFEEFSYLQHNGKEVDEENYTVKEGSTIITLTEEYLKSLDDGVHVFTAVFNSISVDFDILKNVPGEAPGEIPGEAPGEIPGEAPGEETPEEAPEDVPKIGVESNLILWIGIAGLAALGIVAVITAQKRAKTVE